MNLSIIDLYRQTPDTDDLFLLNCSIDNNVMEQSTMSVYSLVSTIIRMFPDIIYREDLI